MIWKKFYLSASDIKFLTLKLILMFAFSPKVGEAIRAVMHQEWVTVMEKVFEVSLKLLKRIKVFGHKIY